MKEREAKEGGVKQEGRGEHAVGGSELNEKEE